MEVGGRRLGKTGSRRRKENRRNRRRRPSTETKKIVRINVGTTGNTKTAIT